MANNKLPFVGFVKLESGNYRLEYVRLAPLDAIMPPLEIESRYFALMGAFRTAGAAKLFVKYGWNNPHMMTVSDCERLYKQGMR